MSATATSQPVAVLLSGRGSNFGALIERSRDPQCGFHIIQALSDRPEAPGLELARRNGIPAASVSARDFAERSAFERELSAAIDARPPALIALAGFMRVLSREFVARYEGRMLNIHPSLLPKYPGLHTHRRALAAHDEFHGATVHFVTAELDGGPPVIQARVPIRPEDDEATLAERVLDQEHRIYPLAVSWYGHGRLRCRDGQAWLDGVALRAPVGFESAPAAARSG